VGIDLERGHCNLEWSVRRRDSSGESSRGGGGYGAAGERVSIHWRGNRHVAEESKSAMSLCRETVGQRSVGSGTLGGESRQQRV